MTRDFKDYFERKYGSYDALIKMFDDGVPYRIIGQHFGNTDSSTVYRWRQRTKKRFDGIYTIKEG